MIPPPRLAVNGVENALRKRIKVARERKRKKATQCAGINRFGIENERLSLRYQSP